MTAILSADVVGYSGLMQADEAGTLERLKANRTRIFDPQVAIHGGRIFKLIGDGALAEFPSVIAAVECALAIQSATEKAAAASRIRYRIGINLGEVIVEGDDIYGEGVNVAARLQTLAPIGGIAVSRTVRDNIEGKLACVFEDMGEHQVKDHERPVQASSVRAAAPAEPFRRPPRTSQKLSICVLPFANMSDDPQQEYFSDGISEDIITDLSKVSALGVIARNTAFQFKARASTFRRSRGN
ncbi:MAG: adenylate/guanylate cyclase domain-containing protein [Rhizomicrobium sp.]